MPVEVCVGKNDVYLLQENSLDLYVRLISHRSGESRPGEDPYGISIAFVIHSVDRSLSA